MGLQRGHAFVEHLCDLLCDGDALTPIDRVQKMACLVFQGGTMAAPEVCWERIQDMFLPSMLKAGAHSHGSGYHVHPDQPRSVAHIAQLHDVLDDHNLAVRIGLAPGGDGKAVTASLDRAHVAELVENNIVDVSVPLDGGTFRLHSNAPGRITAVEYVA